MMARGRLYSLNGGLRCSTESWKTTLGSQGTLLKNRYSDSLKKSQLTLSQGMMKKEDVAVHADNDEEVRTSASQNPAMVTLSTEEFFLRT
jgi:hypothetical protein